MARSEANNIIFILLLDRTLIMLRTCFIFAVGVEGNLYPTGSMLFFSRGRIRKLRFDPENQQDVQHSAAFAHVPVRFPTGPKLVLVSRADSSLSLHPSFSQEKPCHSPQLIGNCSRERSQTRMPTKQPGSQPPSKQPANQRTNQPTN